MSKDIRIDVELFGALRRAHHTPRQSLDVPKGCTVRELLDRLDFSPSEQLYLSVFMNEISVTPDTMLQENAQIKILLPVGGGSPSESNAD